jgi:hypothetical protein
MEVGGMANRMIGIATTAAIGSVTVPAMKRDG